jgi:hypothetical protein
MNEPVKIIASRPEARGSIYSYKCRDIEIEILFLAHALERAKKWQLSVEQVGECLLMPDEVLTGHFGRYVAHKVIGTHMIRAVYEYVGRVPVLVTVYKPRSGRYFEGESRYEDKILD